jgi:hypothetical protein
MCSQTAENFTRTYVIFDLSLVDILLMHATSSAAKWKFVHKGEVYNISVPSGP